MRMDSSPIGTMPRRWVREIAGWRRQSRWGEGGEVERCNGEEMRGGWDGGVKDGKDDGVEGEE